MLRKADKALKENWQRRFSALPIESRKALKEALYDLRFDALQRANYCWKKHKGPMALYWKVVGVYAGHLCRSISVDK